MPSKHNLSVSLTGHLCGFVAAEVASGRFRSASEVVRAGLRLLERDLAPVGQPRGEGSGTALDGTPASPPVRNTP
jgi:hypothetical protein